MKSVIIGPYTYIIVFLLVFSQTISAQQDNIILKAMRDEIDRSMTEMTYEGHEKPFYISYGINDSRAFSVYSSLGSLIRSAAYHNRQKSVRILVGDYEFNDESLDNDLFSTPGASEIEVPLEDDYYGIRRAFWTTTDIVYKSAAQKFKKHQATLKEENKTIKDLPHRTFAKVPAKQTIESESNYKLDKTRWESYCKTISAVFKNYPDIETSEVILTFTQNTKYFVNNEGTTVVKPENQAIVQCRVQLKTKNSAPFFDQFVYYAEIPEHLPEADELRKEGERMVAKLISMQENSALEEEYSGPVLFVGYPVAQVFSNALFGFREGLVASNALPGQNDFRQESAVSYETRIGKSILENAVTVKCTPKQKKYGETTLLGSFSVDDEGVAPADELVLIEKGILRTLLNDRSLTKSDQQANGFSGGPGVVQVSVQEGTSIEKLKEKLIAAAREEGLEFAIIVRGYSGQMGPGEVYKVSVETGKEELLRPSRVNSLAVKSLKRISATSSQGIHHVSLGPSGLTSFIVPDAMLILQADVSPFVLPYSREDETTYVSSPLKK